MKPTATKHKASGKAAPGNIVPSVIKEDDPSPDAQERLNCIATAAYYKAEARGFMPGMELDDWLDAEAEFDERASL